MGKNTHVKSLPKLRGNEVLRKEKGIDGLSWRQAARIFGVSANLIFKAEWRSGGTVPLLHLV